MKPTREQIENATEEELRVWCEELIFGGCAHYLEKKVYYSEELYPDGDVYYQCNKCKGKYWGLSYREGLFGSISFPQTSQKNLIVITPPTPPIVRLGI